MPVMNPLPDWTVGWEPAPARTATEAALAKSYQQNIERTINAAQAEYRTGWMAMAADWDNGMPSAFDEGGDAEQMARRISQAVQFQANAEALGYMEAAGMAFQAPEFVPDTDSPTATKGTPKMLWHMSEGMTAQEAALQSSKLVEQFIAADYQQAMRSTMTQALGSSVAGFRKEAGAGACAWCVEVAQRMYYKGVPWHKNDKCASIPIPRSAVSATDAARFDSNALFGRTTFGHTRAASYENGRRLSPVYERTNESWRKLYDAQRAEIDRIAFARLREQAWMMQT